MSTPSSPIVTRFAPSPTGFLHLGNARTALLNFLAARKSHGRFILRVEDTDESRSSAELVLELFRDLRWLGIDWDEGPDVGGPQQAYRQQQRRSIYEEWLAKLAAAGLTYPCFCTPAELNISRKLQLAAGKPPRYAGTCRTLPEAERVARLARGMPAALRFKVPQGRIVSFVDIVHGEQRFNTDDIGDFIIRRTEGTTAFFFSNALDDALMGITVVMRGDDHMTNTPRQILILEALGLAVPRYGHLALLLGMDGAPLSKRHGAVSLKDLRKRGYLPAAVRNHLVRLGHSPTSDRWLDDAAMREDFDLSRLGKAAAKFDEAQLRHWQREAVARLSSTEFREWIRGELPPGLDARQIELFEAVVRRNVEFPDDARFWGEVAFGMLPDLDAEALKTVHDAGEPFFAAAAAAFAGGTADFKPTLRALSERTGRKGPALFMPLRAALTSVLHGPELAPLLALVPPTEVQARLERARLLAG